MLVPLLSTQRGGVQTQARELATWLERCGHAHVDLIDVPESVLAAATPVECMSAPEAALRSSLYDVVHLHLVYGFGGGAQLRLSQLASSLGAKTVVTVTSSSQVTKLIEDRRSVGPAWLFDCSDAVCVLNGDMHDRLARQGLQASRIVPASNGVDTSRFVPAPTGLRRESRGRLGLPQSEFAVGYVGRLVPRKGLESLLLAWRAVEADCSSSCQLVIIGAQPFAVRDSCSSGYFDHLAELSASLGLRRVSWLGHRLHENDLPACYQALDCLVLPSETEGMPNCILEGFSSGLPVIGTRIPGITELIDDSETGLLVEVNDAAGLATAVRRLAEVPDRTRWLGERARATAVERYDISRAGRLHSRLYFDLVGLH